MSCQVRLIRPDELLNCLIVRTSCESFNLTINLILAINFVSCRLCISALVEIYLPSQLIGYQAVLGHIGCHAFIVRQSVSCIIAVKPFLILVQDLRYYLVVEACA